MKRIDFIKTISSTPFLGVMAAVLLVAKPKIRAARKPKIKSLGFIKNRYGPTNSIKYHYAEGQKFFVRYSHQRETLYGVEIDCSPWEEFEHMTDRKASTASLIEFGVGN